MDGKHPNHDKIVEHFTEILHLLGLNAEDDVELQGTPDRVARLWAERFSGIDQRNAPVIKVLPSPGDQEDMIMIREMPFSSVCAHHLTSFTGICNIAYIPGEQLIGIGTPARVLQHFAKRPQIQERLGEQVATYLTRALNPRGILVHMVARHVCLETRGARTPGHVETTATRGWFSDQEWRSEFFNRLRHSQRL